ncbi:MAG TPA: NAD(+) diphosphatase [Myxococcota bacterium]|nr:NAD(+) diphosphatase [Myxococcota bacterium]
MSRPITFAGSPLDRAALRRRDAAWVAAQLESEASRFLPFWRLNVLVKSEKPELAWATTAIRAAQDPRTGCVFLGVRDEVAHFALDISPLHDPVTELGLAGSASFVELRAAAATLPASDSAIAAQGRQMLDWHARHRFCAVCGRSTSVKEAGYMRECDECDAQHFPRTDPVVIMLVESGDRCLLGRQAAWPAQMYSALAGFVEAGESLEEAVRREVQEEAGITVGEVRYVASQPWPFPSSLMIGCLARAESESVTVDKSELEDARWFARGDILKSLAQPGAGGVFVPPPLAIAHHLIRFWAES